MTLPAIVMLLLIVLLGLVMGSAVTALSWRLPRDLSWIHGRSACTSCNTPLGVADLIPLFSFVFSRGRCRYCGAPIAWRYPITELVCAIWAVLVYRHVGLAPALPWLVVWGGILVALFWIDLDFQLLPDALTLPGTVIGVAAALSVPGGAQHALLGIVTGSGLLQLLAWGYFMARRVEGMGYGDVKLAAMFGAVLGWKLTLITLFLAALSGSVWGAWLMVRGRGSGQTALPFGTLLAPAAMVAFLWGQGWLDAYLGLFR